MLVWIEKDDWDLQMTMTSRESYVTPIFLFKCMFFLKVIMKLKNISWHKISSFETCPSFSFYPSAFSLSISLSIKKLDLSKVELKKYFFKYQFGIIMSPFFVWLYSSFLCFSIHFIPLLKSIHSKFFNVCHIYYTHTHICKHIKTCLSQ